MQLKEKALAASDTSLDTASRSALNTDFISLRNQITQVVNNASFNGINLIKSGSTNVSALANSTGTSVLTVQAQDLSLVTRQRHGGRHRRPSVRSPRRLAHDRRRCRRPSTT